MPGQILRLSDRLLNTPLLIHPQQLDAIIAGLGDRLTGAALDLTEADGAQALLPADMFSTRRGTNRNASTREASGQRCDLWRG